MIAIINNSSDLICRTCIKYVSKGKVPKMAATENLSFPRLPSFV